MFTLIATIALFATATDVRLVAQVGHSAPIHAVAYAPNGRLVVTASADATAKLWDVATGHELRTLAGHPDPVDAVAFSPDGQFVATGSRDRTAKLWEAATGREVRTFPHGNGPVLAVAFSPDGKFLLTGGWDAVVVFWDVEKGEPVRTLPGLQKGISSLAVSPDGRMVAAGSSDYTARLFDAASGALLRTLTAHHDTVSAVAFSPDSKLVATASWDHRVTVWDAASGSVVRTLAHHSDGVTSVAFSPDGRWLLSGSRDLTAVLWDVENGKVLGAATGHTDWVSSVGFSPDGRWLLTASHDKTARRWDSRAEVKPMTLAGRSSGLWAAAFSPNGRVFATAGRDGNATLWDPSTGQPARTLAGHTHWVTSIAFAPDGRSIATASRDETVRLWNVRTGALLRTFAGHGAPVTSVIFSPDGRSLATRANDKSAKVWNVATGAEVHAFAAKEAPVESLAFSPDGRYLITGWNAVARIWDTATWQLIKPIGPHTIDFEMRAVAFSPDGRVVLTASGDGTAKLWNASSGAALRTIDAHAGQILSAAFSPDGRFLLTAGSDRAAKLWNAATGKEIHALAGHTGAVNTAVFSRDGKLVLTAGDDGTARLWEADSGLDLATLIAFEGGGWAVVDRDGRFDAANGGEVDGLYWVDGDEVTELRQLKDRYYEPSLLATLLGGDASELSPVAKLARFPRAPEVTIGKPEKGSTKIAITLRNLGAGIGNVRVLVNNKELADDACGTMRGTNKASVQCSVDLAGAPFLPGDNKIEVVARNIDGTVESRSARPFVQPPDPNPRAPELHAIFVGISTYAAPNIGLGYAAKDANDMARAIELGGRALFGAEHVHVTRLVTDDPSVPLPTKQNIRKAFEAAERAGTEDVLLVYLAGHGTAIADDYVFPTRDATAIVLSDSEARAEKAITGNELREWTNKIRANKQVLILDTCAAGAAARHLHPKARGEKKSIKLALERLRSRTGYFVIMGSAADAASFESSTLEQGLLTYALLLGMKGAALHDDDLVDVSKLFQYAVDNIPQLPNRPVAQRPEIFAPDAKSFPIARFPLAERDRMPPLPMFKPVVLRPLLIDTEAKSDRLGLTIALKNALRERSYETNDIDFPDIDEFTGGVRPEGTYRLDGANANVSLVLRKDGASIASLEVAGAAGDVESLAAELVNAICESIAKRSQK